MVFHGRYTRTVHAVMYMIVAMDKCMIVAMAVHVHFIT